MYCKLICIVTALLLVVLSSTSYGQSRIYNINEATMDYVRLSRSGIVTIGITTQDDTIPCQQIEIVGEGLLPLEIGTRVYDAVQLLQAFGGSGAIEVEINNRCELVSVFFRDSDDAEAQDTWAAFAYGSKQIEEQRERTNPDTGETETYTQSINQIAFGDIFVNSTSRESALENAQLTCETRALEKGFEREICSMTVTIEGGRNACISYVTTFTSSDYGQFIGVSSGENHIMVKNEAVENCVEAVELAGSDQTCDAFNDTKCNDFGHLHDPSQTARSIPLFNVNLHPEFQSQVQQ